MGRSEVLREPQPRRFQLYRREDVSGMSGTGVVAEGIEHRDGSCQYHWITAPGTWQMAQSIEDIKHIHGHNGKTTVRWLDDRDRPGESLPIHEVYEDRNRLAVAFATLARELRDSNDVSDQFRRYDAAWHPPQDADDADADEWAVVWSETPAGQLSWHVPRGMAEITQLAERTVDWDGHTREEKNDRLLDLAGGSPNSQM